MCGFRREFLMMMMMMPEDRNGDDSFFADVMLVMVCEDQ